MVPTTWDLRPCALNGRSADGDDVGTPGFNCAEALLAVHLPFDAVVHALMAELGLTIAEATRAANIAGHLSRDEAAHYVGA